MKIEAGDLRETIAIQSSSDTTDAGGGVARTWNNVAGKTALRASVRQAVGRDMLVVEQLQAGRVNALLQYYVTVRYDGDITEKHRVVWGSKVLPILRVNRWDAKNRWMTMECAEDT